MASPLLELTGVCCSIEPGQQLFGWINLTVEEGDIIVLQGRSGSGKTTLLKCIAHLVPHEGQVKYRGSAPGQLGIPAYRTKVMYVPQRPSLLPGSPLRFLKSILALKAHAVHFKDRELDHEAAVDSVCKRAFDIGEDWGIRPELWDRDWSQLSGGEAQRMLIAVAVSLNQAEVLLLDEPTSALDAETSLLVEKRLVEEVNSPKSALRALVWITHSMEQGRRIGTRFVQLSK